MITFDKEKLYYTNLDNETKEIDSEDLLGYLRSDVEIKDGTTIDHFITHLINNKLGVNVIFRQSLGGHDFELFIDEYQKEPTKKASWGKDGEWKLHYARVYWAADYMLKDTEKYGPEDKNHFDMYAGFDGYGEILENWTADNKKTWNECGLSFSFTPLNQLKNVELKLDKSLRVMKYPLEKDDNLIYLIDDVEYNMNLFTFIDAFLWEISWFGSPDERDEIEKDVLDSALGAEELIKNKDYSKFSSLDDLLNDLEKNDDKNLLD